MYDCVSCMYVCVPHAYLVLKRGDQISALELELWMVFNRHVGTVTDTQVLRKNKCFKLLSHVFSHDILINNPCGKQEIKDFLGGLGHDEKV